MEGRARGRFWLWLTPLALLALPVLYVASVGPAAWMYKHRWLSHGVAEAAESFYEPLSFVADQFPPFDRFLDWYVETCRDVPP